MRLKVSTHGSYINRLWTAAVNSQYSGIQAAESQSISPTGLWLSSTRIFCGRISQWLKQRRYFLARVRVARDCMVASEVEGRVQKNCSWKASTDSNGSIWPKRSTLAQRKEAPMKPLTLPSEGGGSALNCANQPRSVSPKTKTCSSVIEWRVTPSAEKDRPGTFVIKKKIPSLSLQMSSTVGVGIVVLRETYCVANGSAVETKGLYLV